MVMLDLPYLAAAAFVAWGRLGLEPFTGWAWPPAGEQWPNRRPPRQRRTPRARVIDGRGPRDGFRM